MAYAYNRCPSPQIFGFIAIGIPTADSVLEGGCFFRSNPNWQPSSVAGFGDGLWWHRRSQGGRPHPPPNFWTLISKLGYLWRKHQQIRFFYWQKWHLRKTFAPAARLYLEKAVLARGLQHLALFWMKLRKDYQLWRHWDLAPPEFLSGYACDWRLTVLDGTGNLRLNARDFNHRVSQCKDAVAPPKFVEMNFEYNWFLHERARIGLFLLTKTALEKCFAPLA